MLEQPTSADPLSPSRNEKRDTSSFTFRWRNAYELRGRQSDTWSATLLVLQATRSSVTQLVTVPTSIRISPESFQSFDRRPANRQPHGGCRHRAHHIAEVMRT
jgi:hypothetical protein